MSWSVLLWRNLSRNKVRSLLTGGAIALAITLVCFLATIPDGMNRMLDEYATNTRIVLHNDAGLVYPLPYAYMQKVRAMNGVLGGASWTWFGGVFKDEDGVSFPSFAVEPDAIGTVWADWKFDLAELDGFARQRDGAIVGRATMQRYGWKQGEQITLKSALFGLDLSFRIVGEMKNERSPILWFQREYLDQALNARGQHLDTASMIWLRVDDPKRVDSLMREINDTFHNSDSQIAAEIEKSFFKSNFQALEGLAVLIMVVAALVAVCIVFIAANTASMTVRERMREIAILKAIGFSRRTVFSTLVAEATLLASLAGAVGAGASLGLCQLASVASGGWNPQLGPLSWFIVTDTILIEGLFLALFIGIVSGIVPSYGAARRGVAQTFREVF